MTDRQISVYSACRMVFVVAGSHARLRTSRAPDGAVVVDADELWDANPFPNMRPQDPWRAAADVVVTPRRRHGTMRVPGNVPDRHVPLMAVRFARAFMSSEDRSG